MKLMVSRLPFKLTKVIYWIRMIECGKIEQKISILMFVQEKEVEKAPILHKVICFVLLNSILDGKGIYLTLMIKTFEKN